MKDENAAARDLRKMEEEELLDFVQETIETLNRLGDRLEVYARDKMKGADGA